MIKKTISLLLVFFMTFTIAIPSNAYGLETEYDELTEKLGQLLDENGLAAGNSGGSFNPDGNATRAEFVTMANNLFEFSEISDINFADVNANDWYYPEVQKAFNAGYTVGVKETMFAPNDDLTREQAAVMISRIMKLESDTAAADVFTDKSQISNWALGLVGAAAKAEIFKGCDDNSFKPQNPITVAEAVIVFDRVRIKIDESVDDTNETDTTSSNSSSSSSSSNSSNSSNKVSVTAVAVSTTASSIYVGQIITLTSTVNPTNATNKTIVWSVTNGTGNASIDSSTGLLTAIEVGTVTVTATNTNSGVSGTMEVTITVEPDIVFGSIEQDPGHTGGDVLAEVS
ncbi:MAG: S-layer homology domain-containing protein, partial [Sedimentibacter sp.]